MSLLLVSSCNCKSGWMDATISSQDWALLRCLHLGLYIWFALWYFNIPSWLIQSHSFYCSCLKRFAYRICESSECSTFTKPEYILFSWISCCARDRLVIRKKFFSRLYQHHRRGTRFKKVRLILEDEISCLKNHHSRTSIALNTYKWWTGLSKVEDVKVEILLCAKDNVRKCRLSWLGKYDCLKSRKHKIYCQEFIKSKRFMLVRKKQIRD